MTALLKTTIGEIVAANSQAAQLFELLGIDYASHGSLSLREAAAEAGLDVLEVKRSVDHLPQSEQPNWFELPVAKLLNHLRDFEHPELLRHVAEAAAVIGRRCGVCASYPAELDRLEEHLAALGGLVQPHLSREEHVLLPVVEHLENCWTKGERPSMRLTGGVRQAVAAFVAEHGRIAAKIGQIQEVALALSSKPVRCSELLRTVHELSHAVREHLHLQNNILFRRAVALECVIDEPGKARLGAHGCP